MALMKAFLRFLAPIRAIAGSLERLVKILERITLLYEADLDSRQIYPVTEAPKEDMTEVWYGDDTEEEGRPKARKTYGKPGDWFNQDVA